MKPPVPFGLRIKRPSDRAIAIRREATLDSARIGESIGKGHRACGYPHGPGVQERDRHDARPCIAISQQGAVVDEIRGRRPGCEGNVATGVEIDKTTWLIRKACKRGAIADLDTANSAGAAKRDLTRNIQIEVSGKIPSKLTSGNCDERSHAAPQCPTSRQIAEGRGDACKVQGGVGFNVD